MKYTPFTTALIRTCAVALFCLLQSTTSLFATDTTTYYIFKWGDKETERLDAHNRYRGTLVMTPQEFLNHLEIVPYYLRYKQVGKNHEFWQILTTTKHQPIEFTCEGRTFRFHPLDPNESIQTLAFWRHLHPKATAGNRIVLTNIALGQGIYGKVTVLLKAPSIGNESPVWGNTLSPLYVPNDNIADFRWGNLVDKSFDRDYLTMNEFKQLMNTLPTMLPKKSSKSMNLSSIGMRIEKQVTQGTAKLPLSTSTYLDCSHTDSLLQKWQALCKQHLADLPSETKIEIKSAFSSKQYATAYLRFTLVSEGDPRLRLRHTRDTRTVTISLGDRTTSLKGVYTQPLVNAKGDTMTQMNSLKINWIVNSAALQQWQGKWPSISIDNQPANIQQLEPKLLHHDTAYTALLRLFSLMRTDPVFLQKHWLSQQHPRHPNQPMPHFEAQAIRTAATLSYTYQHFRLLPHYLPNLTVTLIRPDSTILNMQKVGYEVLEEQPINPDITIQIPDTVAVFNPTVAATAGADISAYTYTITQAPAYCYTFVVSTDPSKMPYSAPVPFVSGGGGMSDKMPIGTHQLSMSGLQNAGKYRIYIFTPNGVAKKDVVLVDQ